MGSRQRMHMIAALLLGCCVMVSTGCRHARRPLDPLTAAEKQEAERIARADSRVIQLLDKGRTELVYVSFFALKPANPSANRDPDRLTLERAAEVVFYRFDGNFGIRALVSLGRKGVISVERLESADVPLTGQDWTDALQLALKNPEIQQMLGKDVDKFSRLSRRQSNAATLKQNAVRILLIVATSPKDPCFGNRCVQLLFRRGPVYLVDSAIVNLSSGVVQVRKGNVKKGRHP
jgi:Cu2+-containing amine oxidase